MSKKNARLCCFIALMLASNAGQTAEVVEPGGTAQATQEALFNPDQYAWRLFFYLHQQSSTDKRGTPDENKESFRDYEDDKDVVWESWALASGENEGRSEVFHSPARQPVPWVELNAKPNPKILSASLKSSTLIRNTGPAIRSEDFSKLLNSPMRPLFMPFPDIVDQDETRMNKTVYETIRDNRLYSIEGIAANYEQAAKTKAHQVISFAQTAKEVKARWAQITPEQKSRYHWRTLEITKADATKETQIWGLVALHVITRDVPNWFWADFSHIDSEKGSICRDDPDVCPRDTTTRGDHPPSGADGIRRETLGTKWQNYILRGTQIDFVTSTGEGIVLSNPVIERTFQRSSCITCHAHASVRTINDTLENNGMSFDLGAPAPGAFEPGGGEPPFLQMDFLWSIPFRARSERATGGQPQSVMGRAPLPSSGK